MGEACSTNDREEDGYRALRESQEEQATMKT
jgi:hypothetical protein